MIERRRRGFIRDDLILDMLICPSDPGNDFSTCARIPKKQRALQGATGIISFMSSLGETATRGDSSSGRTVTKAPTAPPPGDAQLNAPGLHLPKPRATG